MRSTSLTSSHRVLSARLLAPALLRVKGYMGFEELVNTTLATATAAGAQPVAIEPVSTMLAKTGKVSDKVLRRLRALERAQKAAIAARTK
jgi:hypothetical protein